MCSVSNLHGIYSSPFFATDYVDALFDWIVGDGADASVGSVFVASITKQARKIPLPGCVERIKRSGILAGRTRSLLEK